MGCETIFFFFVIQGHNTRTCSISKSDGTPGSLNRSIKTRQKQISIACCKLLSFSGNVSWRFYPGPWPRFWLGVLALNPPPPFPTKKKKKTCWAQAEVLQGCCSWADKGRKSSPPSRGGVQVLLLNWQWKKLLTSMQAGVLQWCCSWADNKMK